MCKETGKCDIHSKKKSRHYCMNLREARMLGLIDKNVKKDIINIFKI